MPAVDSRIRQRSWLAFGAASHGPGAPARRPARPFCLTVRVVATLLPRLNLPLPPLQTRQYGNMDAPVGHSVTITFLIVPAAQVSVHVRAECILGKRGWGGGIAYY